MSDFLSDRDREFIAKMVEIDEIMNRIPMEKLIELGFVTKYEKRNNTKATGCEDFDWSGGKEYVKVTDDAELEILIDELREKIKEFKEFRR